MKISKQGKKNWKKVQIVEWKYLANVKSCMFLIFSVVKSVVTTTFAAGKPTSLLIQNVDISLNGLITMIKEFMHIVGGFWNPSLFCYGTKLVSVAFMGVKIK